MSNSTTITGVNIEIIFLIRSCLAIKTPEVKYLELITYYKHLIYFFADFLANYFTLKTNFVPIPGALLLLVVASNIK